MWFKWDPCFSHSIQGTIFAICLAIVSVVGISGNTDQADDFVTGACSVNPLHKDHAEHFAIFDDVLKQKQKLQME
jgi:hypothetical protein